MRATLLEGVITAVKIEVESIDAENTVTAMPISTVPAEGVRPERPNGDGPDDDQRSVSDGEETKQPSNPTGSESTVGRDSQIEESDEESQSDAGIPEPDENAPGTGVEQIAEDGQERTAEQGPEPSVPDEPPNEDLISGY